MSAEKTLLQAALSHLDLALFNICEQAQRYDVSDDDRNTITAAALQLMSLASFDDPEKKEVFFISNGAATPNAGPSHLPESKDAETSAGKGLSILEEDGSEQVESKDAETRAGKGLSILEDGNKQGTKPELPDNAERPVESALRHNASTVETVAETAVETAEVALETVAKATETAVETVTETIHRIKHLGVSDAEVAAKQTDMLKIMMDAFEEVDKEKKYAIHHSKLRDMSARLGCHTFHIHAVFNDMEKTSDGLIYQEEWHCIAKRIVEMHNVTELSNMLDRARSFRTGPNPQLALSWASAKAPTSCCSLSSRRYILSLQSRKRVFWDMGMMTLLTYVALTLPLTLAFDNLKAIERVDEVVDYMFMFDLLLNFRTTYLNDQREEIWNPGQIASKYFRTWFVLDFVSCFPFETVSAGMFPGLAPAKLLKVGKVAKAFKIVRIGKMIRIWAGSELMDWWEEIVWSNHLILIFRGLKLLTLLLVLGHWFSCMLLACGGDAARTYFEDEDAHEMRQYLMALYWSIMTMTTVGYGDVMMKNDWERLAAIVAMIIGGAFYGFIIGSVTNILSEHDLNQRAFSERMDIVVDWLNNHCELPPQMRRRVWRHFKQFLTAKKAVEDSIILNDLPPQLCADVSVVLLKDSVRQNPIFSNLSTRALSSLVSAVTQVKFQADEVVVNTGDRGKAMFIVDHGFVHLHKDGKARQLCPGDSFGEEILLREAQTYTYTVKTHSRVAMFRLHHDDFLTNFRDLRQDLEIMNENYANISPDEHDWTETSSPHSAPPHPQPPTGAASLIAGGASGIPPSFPDTVFERFHYLMARIDHIYSTYLKLEDVLKRIAKNDEALYNEIRREFHIEASESPVSAHKYICPI